MQTRFVAATARFLGVLALLAWTSASALVCDVDNNGDINRTDISLITAALNKPATGPTDPRDADGNGVINIIDARACTLRCTRASCALPPTNTAPVATNDSYSTLEDTTLVVAAPGVLGNDIDADGNPLTAVVVAGPASGALVLSLDGSFSYMPAPNFSGSVTFTYRANDGALNSNVATVTLNVTAVNDGPVATPDTYSTAEDTPLTVAAPGVLANDADVDNASLTAALVSGPPASAGTVTLNGNGSFTFTPAANFTGAATFSYVASDGVLASSVTTVTVNVTPVNDVPVANPDAYSTDEDVPLNVAAPGVLGNDTDADGASLTAILVTPPATGTLVLNANGSFTYTPAAGASGPASFTYRASDGVSTSSPATVSLTVLPVNDAPVAANDSYSTLRNTALNVVAPGVLSNDTDQEGNGLAAVLSAGPANGVFSLNANGGFSYTPNSNFTGSDSFSYLANDGALNSNVATVTISVTQAANTAPVAVNDSYSTAEDTPLTVAAPGVLGNDTDPDGNPLTAVLATGPAHGVLVLNANGSFTYTPNANFNGSDSFTYRANDGALNSNLATVTLNVTAANDAPVAVDDSYSTAEDTPLTVAAPGCWATTPIRMATR